MHRSLVPYLQILITLAIISNIISCRNCISSIRIDTVGGIEIKLDQKELHGPNKRFNLIYKLTDPDNAANLANYNMKISINKQGGRDGQSKIIYTSYNEQGNII